MAITDTSVSAAHDAPAADDSAAAASGLASLFGSGDHKVIGRLFIGFSLLMGIGSFAALGLTALSQKAGTSFPKADWVLQLSTLGRVGAVFFFLVPLFLGLAVYVCPLQVGAATVAFPRAVAASFWTWLVASALAVVAYAGNGGPGGGDEKLVDLSYFATGVAIVALLVVAIAVATTVVTFRADGMTLDRVPFFSWSMVVAAGVWALTLPVLLAEFVLIYVDHRYGGPGDFASPTKQWGYISWAFAAPQAFAYAVPALGIAADGISTLTRSRQPQRGFVFTAIGAAGVLSIGAWVQPAFYGKIFTNEVFVVWSVLLALPVLMFVGGIGGSLARGRFSGKSPVLAGLLAVVGLLLAAVGAALFAISPLRLHEAAKVYPDAVADVTKNTWFQPLAQVGVFGMIVLAGAVAAVGGLAYWGPKITGKNVADGAGKAAAPLLLLGALLFGTPFIVMGLSGRWNGLGETGTVDTLSLIATAGAGVAVLGLLAIALGLLMSLTGSAAADDPWGAGQTLEWATSSPPARGNFGALPVVTSAEPLLDVASGEAS